MLRAVLTLRPHCATSICARSLSKMHGRPQSREVGTSRFILCADFDQTLSAHDTIQLLFDAANQRRQEGAPRADHAQCVQELVAQYIEEANALSETTTLPSPPGDLDIHGLRDYLARFAAVDLASIERVIASGALSDLQDCDLRRLGQGIEFMAHSRSVLLAVPQVYVISSNWSETMLQAAIARHLAPSSHPNLRIVSNDLVVDDRGFSTGNLTLRIQSPDDKAQWIEDCRRRSPDGTIVYVGDSTNDLLGLLAADVGILLVPDPRRQSHKALSELCQRYGVELRQFALSSESQYAPSITKKLAKSEKRSVIYTCTSWLQIEQVLDHIR